MKPRWNSNPRFFYYGASLLSLLLLTPIRASVGDGNLPPLNPTARFFINLLFVNSLLAYGGMLFGNGQENRPLTGRAWLVLAGIGVLLCMMPPVFSGDVHEYLMRGRILGVYHQNPYVHTALEFPHDPFFPLSVWNKWPDDYGPSWTLVQWIAPTLFGFSYFSALFAQKLVVFVFLALSGWLFFKISRQVWPERAHWMTQAFLLNPNFLVHHLVDGHNDIATIFYMLLAVFLLLRSKLWMSLSASTLAFLAKMSSVVLMPVIVIAWFRLKNVSSCPERGFLVLRAVACVLIVSAALYAPFWVGPQTLTILNVANGWFYTNSVPYAIYIFLGKMGLPVAAGLVENAFYVFFVLTAAGALLWLLLKKSFETKDIFRVLSFIFLVLYLSYSVPFYGSHLNWALPFIILSEFPLSKCLILLYTTAGLFAYFKRLSFLYLGAVALYFLFLTLYKRVGKPGILTK